MNFKKKLVLKLIAQFLHTDCDEFRAVVSGGAGGALASPEFGSSLNPIPARGGRLCPPHYW